jgi:heat shock protein HslJ
MPPEDGEGGNATIRILRFGIAAIALGAMMAGAGCSTSEEAATPQLAGTTWRAETIMGRPVVESSVATITFEPDGRVHGGSGCNRYFGTSTVDGDRVSFGAMGATKMACPEPLMDQETRFFRALESAERWTIDDQGMLVMHSAGADEPSRFARSPE